MKTLKLSIAIAAVLFLTNGSMTGQVLNVDVVVNFYEYDYTPYTSILGIVSGSYTYHYVIKLDKDGEIESLHWNVTDCNLHNQYGDKIIVVDSGRDNLGVVWSFFSSPNAGNGYDPGLVYDVEDGWLDVHLPEVLPIEGTYVNMSFRMMIKGKKWDAYASMVQLHINANGVITADVVKL